MKPEGSYYNEIDPFAANWLRNLMAAGLIASGVVDERDINDVHVDDIRGFVQCHFFAGIGGWSHALRLAGWPDDRPVWTGSCPCQPLSSAGQHKGHVDKRHLWPAFFRLISERKPPTVFGEQVASKDGREWLAGVRVDLETVGYACGAADLCAAGVGAPHIRQRLYWVADTDQSERKCTDKGSIQRENWTDASGSRDYNWVGNSTRKGLERQRYEHRPVRGRQTGGHSGPSMQTGQSEWNGSTIRIDCTDGQRRIPPEPALFPVADGVSHRVGILRGAGNAIVPQVAAQFITAFMECRP